MPLDPTWLAIAREIPDARAKRAKNELKHRLLGWMEPIFCTNCGCDGGMISRDWAAYVTYLCDACVETYGHPPLTEAPESLIRGDMR